MIDLHAHMLPGVDDGAADDEAALALAAAAHAEGVTRLAATPHLRHDFPDVHTAELASRTAALQERLDAAGVALTVVSGGEVDLVWAEHATDEQLRQASYGGAGHWLLVETPYAPLTFAFEPMLAGLHGKGFRLLLAHPERNATFQSDPARLAGLVERGVHLQVTAASLADRRRGSASRRLADALVRDGLAHVIASDRHAAGDRTGLLDGVRAAERHDARRARWMVTEAPAAILAGDVPQAPPPARRSWLRRRG